jgi:Cu+-exporting ATPase
VLVGNERLMADRRVAGCLTGSDGDAAAELAAAGKTPVYVAVDGRLAGLIAIADPVKPGAAAAIAACTT